MLCEFQVNNIKSGQTADFQQDNNYFIGFAPTDPVVAYRKYRNPVMQNLPHGSRSGNQPIWMNTRQQSPLAVNIADIVSTFCTEILMVHTVR